MPPTSSKTPPSASSTRMTISTAVLFTLVVGMSAWSAPPERGRRKSKGTPSNEALSEMFAIFMDERRHAEVWTVTRERRYVDQPASFFTLQQHQAAYKSAVVKFICCHVGPISLNTSDRVIDTNSKTNQPALAWNCREYYICVRICCAFRPPHDCSIFYIVQDDNSVIGHLYGKKH